MTPSTISLTRPFASIAQNFECEVVARNIMVILARTGDSFRELSLEEYKAERQKDFELNPNAQQVGFKEVDAFDKVKNVALSKENAANFCSNWKKLLTI